MAKPKFSIIVPNYMGRKVFPNCIRSLLKQDIDGIQIVLVDDSSTDGSVELARKLFGKERRVRIVQTPRNSGYVGACNYALRFCEGTYIFVTNNDATFPKDWVREMHRTVAGKKNVIGASIILEGEGEILKEIEQGRYGDMTLTLLGSFRRDLTPLERETGFFEVHTSGVLIIPRRALGKKIFDEDYFAYGEDVHLCWRMRQRGYHIVVNKRARMRHLGSFTRRTVPAFNKRAIFNGTKNMITNFLVLYSAKNVVRIMPMFLLLQGTLFLVQPRAMPYRLKAYWWVLTHPGAIRAKRKEAQSLRTEGDEEIIRLMGYKLQDEALVKRGKRVLRFANACAKAYYRIVGLRTYDMAGPHATPLVDEKAVRPSGKSI